VTVNANNSDNDFGHEQEHLQLVYAGGVGMAGVELGRQGTKATSGKRIIVSKVFFSR
jgi:hypothetical protein